LIFDREGMGERMSLVEQELAKSGVAGTILRFSLVLAEEGGVLVDFERQANFGPFIIIPGSGQAHMQPILREDAARIIVETIGRADLLGKIIELGDRDALYKNPLHPYTQSLLSAVPIPDPIKERKRRRIVLKGDIPSPVNPPPGCRFHTRCPVAFERCKIEVPPLTEYGVGHLGACHWVEEHGGKAPDVAGSVDAVAI